MMEKMRVFEVKGHEIPLDQLPSGHTQSEWTTMLEEIRPQELEKNFQIYKHKLLANLIPRDIEALQQIEQRMV